MDESIKFFVGLDAHRDGIPVAVCTRRGGAMSGRPKAKLVLTATEREELRPGPGASSWPAPNNKAVAARRGGAAARHAANGGASGGLRSSNIGSMDCLTHRFEELQERSTMPALLR